MSKPNQSRRRKATRLPGNWAKTAQRPEPYNPLDLANLGRSVELKLLASDPVRLADIPIFVGAGVYAIYYSGDHELYEPISSGSYEIPIYVGKAIPAGGRKGLVDETKETAPLWKRLQEHKESLKPVHDLDERDFAVRYLVTIDVFIPLAERVMIRQLKPVWNVVVDGFGNHDPGANRRKDGQRPPWDELHPGRWWSTPEEMPTPSKVTEHELRERVRSHLARGVKVTPETAMQLESDDLAKLIPEWDDDDPEEWR
ncbi:Eco29kI family restriction endonuclease [Phytohabitans kaempferiae]|uniref:Eco29kI family restriction endonuclease n=1 Tax=Phytohabitans kaempferiae TaxID=1620943 RepID=A0ABV6MES9_9ACTN